MVARFRSWWQLIKQQPVRTVLIALLSIVVVLIILSILGYIFNWHWTGLVPETSEPKQHWKTLWDWLQLLIIPAVLAVAGYVINLTISRGEQAATEQRAKSEREVAEKRADTERQIAKERYEQDQQIALDKQRQDLLQAYLDRMSELLLEKGLRTSQADAEVRNVARTRTISVLRQLDAVRVGDVFTFLCEAGLMETPEPIVRLGDANLSKVNWSEADLTDANLSVAVLSGADLRHTLLGNADLSGADLGVADLSNALIWKANLSGAYLSNADLSGAYLTEADLRATDLSKANLSNADLGDANLSMADLSGANLKGAIGIAVEELEKQAKSLKGATMPDGSKHP